MVGYRQLSCWPESARLVITTTSYHDSKRVHSPQCSLLEHQATREMKSFCQIKAVCGAQLRATDHCVMDWELCWGGRPLEGALKHGVPPTTRVRLETSGISTSTMMHDFKKSIEREESASTDNGTVFLLVDFPLWCLEFDALKCRLLRQWSRVPPRSPATTAKRDSRINATTSIHALKSKACVKLAFGINGIAFLLVSFFLW